MSANNRPFVMMVLLMAIAMRAIIGAPCCMTVLGMDGGHHGAHAHHAPTHHASSNHTAHDHGAMLAEDGEAAASTEGEETAGDPSANPCCSACSPPLPADPVQLIARSAPRELPEPMPVRALATRPPFPAYEATGPPALI